MATKSDDIIDGYAFHWKLENVSHCWSLRKDFGIASLDFNAFENTKWSISLDFKSEKDENYFSTYLEREIYCSGPNNGIEVNYQLALLGSDGSVLKNRILKKINFNKGNGYGCEIFESREKVFVSERGTFLPEDTLTIQCIMWKKDAPVRLKRLYARTVFKMDKGSFLWRIDDFCTIKSCLKNNIKHNIINFDLVLDKSQDFEKNLVLNINSFNEEIKCFSFQTSIVDSEGNKENCEFHEYFREDLEKGVLSVPLFTERVLENKSRYFPNDVLLLDCEYSILTRTCCYEFFGSGLIIPKVSNEVVENTNPHHAEKEKSQKASNLVDDWKSMYTNTILCDTELRTTTNTFPAHKNILSARSPVFRVMFSSDMKEKNSGHVDINDMEDDTVKQLLQFIYTDSLADLQFESASKLYEAADKYEIIILKNKCSSFLKEHLCPTNVCDVLHLSDLHQDDNLKGSVLDYILKHDKEVFGSQKWKDFMGTNLKLAADVMYRKVYPD